MAICEIQTKRLPGGGVQKPSSQIASSPPALNLIRTEEGFPMNLNELLQWLTFIMLFLVVGAHVIQPHKH